MKLSLDIYEFKLVSFERLRMGSLDLRFGIYDLGLFVSLRNPTFIFFAHNFFCICCFLNEYLLNFVVYETRSVALHQYKNHIKP